MVWIHGGAWVIGAGSEATCEGHGFARRGVVLVTFNYRLGPLGFMAHGALSAEDPAAPGSGSYGLMDQQAALRWVRDNVAGFGGDPGNVTIFGQSAGGASTCLHFVASGSEGLFHKAIMQSGVCSVASALADAELEGAALSAAVGCAAAGDEQACLRDTEPAALLDALPVPPGLFFGEGASWGPVQDGTILTGNPALQLITGEVPDVPTIIGATLDEGSIFVALAGGGLTEASYRETLERLLPAAADDILAEYPVAAYADADAAAAAALGEGLFACSARLGARVLATAGTPVWMYQFAHPVDTAVYHDLGAFHAGDLMYTFGNPLLGGAPSADEQPLVEAIQAAWVRFAAEGDPGDAAGLAWPRYDTGAEPFLRFALPVGLGDSYLDGRCDFWDGIYLSL